MKNSNRFKRRIAWRYTQIAPCKKNNGKHEWGDWQVEFHRDERTSNADRMLGLADDKTVKFRKCVHCGKRLKWLNP